MTCIGPRAHHAKNILKYKELFIQQTKWFLVQETNPARTDCHTQTCFLLKTSPERKTDRVFCTNWFYNVDVTKLLMVDDASRMRSSGAKLKCEQVHSDCAKYFFTNTVVRNWNTLPPLVVQCSSIDFNNRLDRCLLHFDVH